MVSFIWGIVKWLAALFVATGIFITICILMLAGLSQAFQPEPVRIADDSILVLDLGIDLVDSPRSVDPLLQIISELEGNGHRMVPLRRALNAIDRAMRDETITGILVKGHFSGAGSGNSLATLKEFRGKLAAFQSAGKPVWAYMDNDGLAEFYVKSVADHLWMNPYSLLEFKGLGVEMIYWGAAFDRFGIGVQVEKAGKYKTAAESFVASSMSVENRNQLTRLLETMWAEIRTDIGSSLAIPVETLDRVASEKALMLSDEARSAGLVDALLSKNELIERLAEHGAYDSAGRTFRQIGFVDYLNHTRPSEFGGMASDGAEIAVVYAEGTIVDGEGNLDQVGGDRIARILRAVRKDESVKAVVLRVNSPGGSATAAEKILREVELTNSVKPVVVSMGGYAASGGYWIATLAETIFAEPTTVTGSIGVFSLLPNIGGLADKFDIHVERVETNDLTTMFSIFRPKTPEEMERMGRFVDVTYDHFLERVMRGRDLTPAAAEAAAEGRVWSGVSALEMGLVDQLGGLEDAIAHAADLAGLGDDFEVSDHPRREGWEELIADYFSGNVALPEVDLEISGLVGQPRLERLEAEIQWLRQINDPRHLYAYSPIRIQW